MFRNPLVSVLIPVYNGESFIARAVESVLSQTCQDFEIIIIDDGSTDKTQTALAHLAQTFKIMCLHQNNAGPAQARNLGIQSATGEHIAFLDCDDIWFPEKLEQQLAILRGTSQPGLVHSNYEVIACDGRVIQHAKAGISCDPLHQAFTGGHAPLLSTTVVSRGLLERVGGFDVNLWIAEDSDLFMRLYEVSKFKCLDLVMVQKFQQTHGSWDIPSDQRTHQENILSSRERFLARLQNRPTLNKQQREALKSEWSSYYLMKGAVKERQEKWSEARWHYLTAIQKKPFRFRGYSRLLRTARMSPDLSQDESW